MWKTYLSSSFKILSKHRVTAVINILGLSLSLSCIILILLFVQDEFQYDRFHQKGDRIYRVTRDFWSEGTQSLHLATVPAPVGAYLEEEFPELEASLRMMKTEAHFLVDNQGFKEESGYYAEASIFELFDFQLLQGNPAKSLDEPFTLLLSQDLAQKYYPQQQIVGKTLLFKIHDQKIPLRITGVFEALPSHSHFHPQFLISFPTLESNKVYRNGPHPRFWGREGLRNNWGANSFLTYVLLPESSNPAAFASRLDPFMDKYFSSYAISEGWWQEGEQKKASDFSHLYLQKLGDIHLYSHLDMEAEVNGEILNVYIFSLIALLILIIAVINYVNLSIAQSAQRAKEIGVRKVIGAQRENLIFQFLLESSALTLLAIFLALGLVELVLPFLNDFLGKTLSLGVLMQPFWIMGGSVLWLLLSFIAGIYPAWYLSSFDPVLVLKGGMLYGYKGGFLRKALVTLQFTAAISLMICTAFVYQQLQFIKAKSLGFEKENILTLTYYPALQTKYNSFRQALLQSPDIAYVSRSSHIPSSQLLNDVYASPQSNPNDSVAVKGVLIKELGIDMDFMATYGVPLMAGRNFSPQYGQDENAAYLINKKACDLLGWAEPAQAIDQALNIRGVNGRIIGVVDDFHFESLHEEIKPTLFNLPGAENYFKIAVKVKGNQVAPAIAYLKKTWKEFLPEAPFAYSFLDEKFEKLYLAEKRVGGLFFAFTGLAIGIACLGLFGLISFVSQQRTKEIGIRKVLGAQLLHLFALLSKSYLLLISLAIGIAFIITSLVISEWLKNFAYHIDLLDHWYIFMFSGLVALLITGFTLSLQILKVARLNPIDTLRSE